MTSYRTDIPHKLGTPFYRFKSDGFFSCMHEIAIPKLLPSAPHAALIVPWTANLWDIWITYGPLLDSYLRFNFFLLPRSSSPLLWQCGRPRAFSASSGMQPGSPLAFTVASYSWTRLGLERTLSMEYRTARNKHTLNAKTYALTWPAPLGVVRGCS